MLILDGLKYAMHQVTSVENAKRMLLLLSYKKGKQNKRDKPDKYMSGSI